MSQEQQVIEEVAATVEEAVDAGLARLGLSEESVDIEVVDEGRRGLLGIGGREATVRLHVRTPQKDTQAQEPPPAVIIPQSTVEPEQPVVEPAPETAVGSEESGADTNAAEPGDETEVARQIVEDLLRKMDVTASISVTLTEPDDITGRRLSVLNITGEDLGLLIGARGETLDAMQHLSRLMVGHRIRQRAYFVIDVEGYRERREQALSRLAERMGQKAIDRGTPVTLEPMPAYERRIIHMTLRENPQVRTESTGEGDRRKVRIYPL